jgi:hypothetical protein
MAPVLAVAGHEGAAAAIGYSAEDNFINAHPEGWRERPCEAPATTTVRCPRQCPQQRDGASRGHALAGANSGPRSRDRRDR